MATRRKANVPPELPSGDEKAEFTLEEGYIYVADALKILASGKESRAALDAAIRKLLQPLVDRLLISYLTEYGALVGEIPAVFWRHPRTPDYMAQNNYQYTHGPNITTSGHYSAVLKRSEFEAWREGRLAPSQPGSFRPSSEKRRSNKGGAPPEYPWTEFDHQVLREVKAIAADPKQQLTQTELRNRMKVWASATWDEPPADRTVDRRLERFVPSDLYDE